MISPLQLIIFIAAEAEELEKVIPGSNAVVKKQFFMFTIEAALPVIERNSAVFDVSFNPLILHVPAVVIDSLPVIVGVFKLPPTHPTIFTPAVKVTSSVTLSRITMVSPEEASAIAPAKVVCVPLAADVATINF